MVLRLLSLGGGITEKENEKNLVSLPNWPSKSYCLNTEEKIELLKIKDKIMIQCENNNMLLLQNVVQMGSLH